MAKKKFVLRLEAEKMKAVEKWAADEFRSTNGQLEWIITKALNEAGRWKKKSPETPSTEKSPSSGDNPSFGDDASPGENDSSGKNASSGENPFSEEDE